jgi:hypothetical protein
MVTRGLGIGQEMGIWWLKFTKFQLGEINSENILESMRV